MKSFRFVYVFAGLTLGTLATAQAAVETYDIDPVHSWVGFTVSHFSPKCQPVHLQPRVATQL